MQTSITLAADERNALLDHLRRFPVPELRARHIYMLLADGYPWATIAAVLDCSSRTISCWQQRFGESRADGLLGHQRGDPSRLTQRWSGSGTETPYTH